MVTQLLGLKFQLIANSFRRSPGQVFGLTFVLLYAIGATIAIAAGFTAIQRFGEIRAGELAVCIGSLLMIGFIVVPLAFGANDALDPRSFSATGISPKRLASGLVIASFLGIPVVALVVIAAAQASLWAAFSGALPVALLSGLLIVVTGILGARVATAVAAAILASDLAREATRLVALAFGVCLAPVAVLLFSVDWRLQSGTLSIIADVAGWTPFGAAWSAPAEAAAGNSGLAFAKLSIAAASIGLLLLAWYELVRWMLGHRGRDEHRPASSRLGWFDFMPRTATGAIAARSITYWLRDPRYHVALVAIPIAPVIFVSALAVAGVPLHVLALIPVPVMCLFLAWMVHNDVAYDSSAIWMHVSSNVDGKSDRFGRLVPPLIIGIPLIALGSPLCAIFFGDFSVLPSIIGVSSSALFAGLGLSSVISARFPYPSTSPGDSAFALPQTSNASSGLIQSLAFFASLVVMLPSIVLAATGILFDGPWPVITLLVGLVLGLIVFALGVIVGGAVFRRRSAELLAFTLRN